MVVLSRQRDEAIIVGGDVLVTVTLVRGDYVTLEVENRLSSLKSSHRLTRDQEILVRDDISLVIVDIRGETARLGFVAPVDVEIHRKEVWEALNREMQAAAWISGSETQHELSIRSSQTVVVGGTMRLKVLAIGRTCVFLKAEGHLDRGADDGLVLDRVLELAKGEIVKLGARFRLWLWSISTDEICLHIGCGRDLSIRLE